MTIPLLEQLPVEIAKALLEINAVMLRPADPFTWTSGLKSPIYCDNRLTMSYPEIRDRIAEGFAAVIRER
ncbi:orotate phosphoribosyltransferase, partial [Paenibacillus sepulcri]|nr:orotate phosphoribosyltransferase [Paenibacillus sepulcri]